MADAAIQTPDSTESAPAAEKAMPMDRVEELLREHWGLSGQIFPVEEGRGAGFLVDNGHMRYLLEIRSPDDEAALRVEHEVMRHIIRSPDGPPVCEPVATKDGEDLLKGEIIGEPRIMRLLTVLEGEAPPPAGPLSATTGASLGILAASLARSLEDFDLTAWDGEHEDELRKAGPRTVSLLSEVEDQETRDFIARAMVSALRRIHPLTQGFRIGLTVPDLSLDILAGEEDEDGDWHATGITDLSGLAKSWQVSALAKSCAHIISSHAGDPASALSAIAAYHAIDPLNDSEIEALWPLIMAELALVAAVSAHHHARNPQEEQAGTEAQQARSVLANASAATATFMHATILDTCGIEPGTPDFGALLPQVDADQIRVADLGTLSPLFQDGNWTDPDCDWKLLARIAWETGMGSTRYGEYRLSRTGLPQNEQTGEDDEIRLEPQNVALHVDVCLPAGTAVASPLAGTVTEVTPRLQIRGRDFTLLLEGVTCDHAEGAEIARDGLIGKVTGEPDAVGGIRVRFSRDPETVPPLFCKPSEAGLWRYLAPSPATALRLDCDAPIASAGRIARAWREFLYDEDGHILLDFGGGAPLVGHGHPAIATASYRQHLLISAPHGDLAVSEALRQALSEVAPAGLGHVVLFPDRDSALEAFEMLVGSDLPTSDLPTSEDAAQPETDDLPEMNEAETEASPAKPDEELATEDDEPHLPSGITFIEAGADEADLAEQISEAKQNGHLVFADETRVGYGRLGDRLWNIDQEGFDVDAVLAGACDGSPLTIVFCNEALAGYLQAARPSVHPVMAATALAALNSLLADDLMANAKAMGEIMEGGLHRLADRSDGGLEVSGHGLLWRLQPKSETTGGAMLLDRGIVCAMDEAGGYLLLPPLCVSETSIRHCLGQLSIALGLLDKTEI